jgi:hypothetical protein
MISDLEAIRQKKLPASGSSAGEPDKPPESVLARPPSESRCPPGLPSELVQHYGELLRTYVIMGSGNLVAELTRLAELLTTAGVSARQTMHLHLHVLEELIHGLGARSTRHVMTRADLLVLEIMIHLAEGYRQRYQERIRPPLQRLLPGFHRPETIAA